MISIFILHTALYSNKMIKNGTNIGKQIAFSSGFFNKNKGVQMKPWVIEQASYGCKNPHRNVFRKYLLPIYCMIKSTKFIFIDVRNVKKHKKHFTLPIWSKGPDKGRP